MVVCKKMSIVVRTYRGSRRKYTNGTNTIDYALQPLHAAIWIKITSETPMDTETLIYSYFNSFNSTQVEENKRVAFIIIMTSHQIL